MTSKPEITIKIATTGSSVLFTNISIPNDKFADADEGKWNDSAFSQGTHTIDIWIKKLIMFHANQRVWSIHPSSH